MKGEDILRGLNYTEESLVEEALQKPSRNSQLKKWMMAAACMLLAAIGITAVLRIHRPELEAGLDPNTVGIDLSPYFDMEHDQALAQMQADSIVFDEEKTRPDDDHGGTYVIKEEIQGLTFYTILNFARYDKDSEELRLAGAIKNVKITDLSKEQRDSLNRIYKTMMAQYGVPEVNGVNNLTVGTKMYGLSELPTEELKTAFENGTLFNEEFDLSGLQLNYITEDGTFAKLVFNARFPEYGSYSEDGSQYGYFLDIYESSPETSKYWIEDYLKLAVPRE